MSGDLGASQSGTRCEPVPLIGMRGCDFLDEKQQPTKIIRDFVTLT
jgi:hypothetical protein